MAPTQIILTVLFGAIAGGVTNSVAIWMLFHPYEPPRVGRRTLRFLQGAVPKNKARLASAMGRTVGNQLLAPGDLARALDRQGFRAAFEEKLASVLRDFLERDRGSLARELPARLADELRALLHEISDALLARLREYLEGEEFRATARGWAEGLAAELHDRPIGDLLTEEREEALGAAAERWIGEATGARGFESAVDEYLERTAERLLAPGRTFEQLLPMGLVAAFERAVAGYLPLAIERLGTLLEDADTREKAEHILHEVLDRFMRDLKFHQRLVASLLITPETVDRVLRAVEAEGASKLSELLQDPAVRDAMARGVNDAVVDFLRKPVRSVLGSPEDTSVQDARETVRKWLLDAARDPHTSRFLVEKLKATLSSLERRTWGDVFRHIPPEGIADAVVAAARSERAASAYHETADRLLDRLLDQPIGRLAGHLPPEAADRIRDALAEPLWAWIIEQVPVVVERVEISRRVEEKILEFPPERVEDLIRAVTGRELKLIVRLGYVLGAMIGGLSVLVGILAG